MARRDVDLVIRAKDEAKGAINAVTNALEQFVTGQNKLQAEAVKTDSALSRVGSALSELQKALGGVNAGAKVSSELDKARESVSRLEKATAEARAEAAQYGQELSQASRAVDDLKISGERAARAVDAQTRAVSEASLAQQKLTTITESASRERARLIAADGRLNTQIDSQSARLGKLSAAYEKVKASTSAAGAPAADFQQKVDRAAQAISSAQSKLEELRTTQAVVRQSIESTNRALERADRVYGSTARGLQAQSEALQDLVAAQTRASQRTSSAVRNQKALQGAASDAARAVQRQADSLDKAQTAYAELSQTASQTSGTLGALEAKVRGPLLRAFGEQASRVQALQKEFRETSREAQRLAVELRATANPSEALVSTFEKLRADAARTRQAFRQQQEELGALRRVLRESGGDVEAFASRQQRVQAILARAIKGYAEYGAALDRVAAKRLPALPAPTIPKGAGGAQTWKDAVDSFFGPSREALSLTQRWRSEVLALTAAYSGLGGAASGLRAVINANRDLEAATNRLQVVFEGDKGATANELDFIRRNAERLGVQFGSLATEYTKFAVATKGTNLEGEETRRIFISVAEAARVNNSSLPELQGVFLALTQIVSKGSVSMEELRQQLGDRLPGAVQLMADAAGVGTKELIKMIENGELGSDVLSGFADQLDKKFGPQLAQALRGTTAEIGRLQDGLFQAASRFGQGGFIESFTALIRQLNETVRSADFIAFIDRLSSALAELTGVVAILVDYFQLVSAVVAGALGLKYLTPFVVVAASKMGILQTTIVGLPATLKAVSSGFRLLGLAVTTSVVGFTRAEVAVVGLRTVMAGLLSSTGIGLAVLAVSAGISLWATEADAATEALTAHKEILDTVRNAYDVTGKSVEAWRKEVGKLTLTEVKQNLEGLKAALKSAREELDDSLLRRGTTILERLSQNPFIGVAREYEKEAKKLAKAYDDDAISSEELLGKIDDLNQKYDDGSEANKRFAKQLVEATKKITEADDAVRKAELIIIALTGTSEEAAAALSELSGEAKTVEDAFQNRATKAVGDFQGKLDELKKFLPTASKEMSSFADEVSRIDEAFNAALTAARALPDAIMRIAAEQEALKTKNEALLGAAGSFGASLGGDGVTAAANLLKEFEGFISTPQYDVNALRAGYGSDTVTLSDGSVRAVTEGISVSVEDANRDLVRRIGEFQDTVRGQIGSERFASFPAAQQAVLTSIAYNYGSLPERIVGAVRMGSTQEIADAIRGLQNDGPFRPSGEAVNNGRRNREADIFAAGGSASIAPYVQAQEAAAEAARDAADQAERERAAREEAAAQQREATAGTIADGNFEIEQQQRLLAGKEREAAIQEAIRNAKAANPAIGEQELAQISEQAGRLFDLKNQQKEVLTDKEKAAAAEQKVNDLLALRAQLLEQLAALVDGGGSADAIAKVESDLVGVNTQLKEATAQAIKMYEALGSSEPAVAATISKLQTLELTSNAVANKFKIDWKQVESILANSLVSAANRFSESLAEGKSVSESAGDAFRQFASDFLRQIGQMILQQLALNAARAIMGGFGFGGGVAAGVAHSGGIAGSTNRSRRVDPAMFANAMRFHNGGLPGLASNEVPAILQKGEEVLTQGDPRHIFNGGMSGGATGSASSGMSLKIVNVLDAADIVEQGLSSRAGEQAVLNVMKNNPGVVKAVIGNG